MKEIARLHQSRHRGLSRVGAALSPAVTACNLVRLPRLLATTA